MNSLTLSGIDFSAGCCAAAGPDINRVEVNESKRILCRPFITPTASLTSRQGPTTRTTTELRRKPVLPAVHRAVKDLCRLELLEASIGSEWLDFLGEC